MEIRQLESLFWIATLGSFSAAANRLNTTQPTISARIQGLEQELGITLFDRDASPIRATAKALEIFPAVKLVLETIDSIKSAAVGNNRIAGTVRLGVASVVAQTWLSKVIVQLNERYPGIEPEITVGYAPELRELLVANALDVIVSIEPLSLPGLESRFLREHRVDWLADRMLALPLRALGPADLAAHCILMSTRRTSTHEAIAQFFQAGGVLPIRSICCNSTALILELAEQGLGICALPAILAEKQLKSGRLQLLSAEPPLPSLKLYVTHRVGPLQKLGALLAGLIMEVGLAAEDPSFE